jgi:anti-anti-sigma regulatory factor
MKVRYAGCDGKYVIYPIGEMSLKAARKIKSLVRSLLKAGGYCYTLDLKGVTCLDSDGLRALRSIDAFLELRGKSFQIRNIATV